MWEQFKLMVLWHLAARTLIKACDAFESYQWFREHGFDYEYLRDRRRYHRLHERYQRIYNIYRRHWKAAGCPVYVKGGPEV